LASPPRSSERERERERSRLADLFLAGDPDCERDLSLEFDLDLLSFDRLSLDTDLLSLEVDLLSRDLLSGDFLSFDLDLERFLLALSLDLLLDLERDLLRLSGDLDLLVKLIINKRNFFLLHMNTYLS